MVEGDGLVARIQLDVARPHDAGQAKAARDHRRMAGVDAATLGQNRNGGMHPANILGQVLQWC